MNIINAKGDLKMLKKSKYISEKKQDDDEDEMNNDLAK